MGIKERDRPLITQVIPDVKKPTLRGVVNDVVEKGSKVSTDELFSYGLLTGDGYTHGTVQHGKKEYAYYDYRQGVTHHVNHVESFWKLFKAAVRSTHIMSRYLDEFTFRQNHGERINAMVDLMVGRCDGG